MPDETLEVLIESSMSPKDILSQFIKLLASLENYIRNNYKLNEASNLELSATLALMLDLCIKLSGSANDYCVVVVFVFFIATNWLNTPLK